MGVSKVVYNNRAVIDLTKDSVSEYTLAEGTTAHNSSGQTITGLMKIVTVDSSLSSTSTNPVQNRAIVEYIDDLLATQYYKGTSFVEPTNWKDGDFFVVFEDSYTVTTTKTNNSTIYRGQSFYTPSNWVDGDLFMTYS